MAKCNLPCCIELQLATQIISVVHMVLNILVLLGVLLLLVINYLSFQSFAVVSGIAADAETATMALLLVTMVLVLSNVILAVQLLRGAKTRNRWRCRTWFQVQLLTKLVTFLCLPFVIWWYPTVTFTQDDLGNEKEIVHLDEFRKHMWPWLTFGFVFICNCYQLWIVATFMEEVKKEELSEKEKDENQVELLEKTV